MRLLVLAPRFPQMHGKGDQIRAFVQIQGLAPHHEITVLTGAPAGDVGADKALRRLARVEVHPGSRLTGAAAALAGLPRLRPVQVSWMFPLSAWERARALSEHHDVVLANTLRAVRGALPKPMLIDHVDALSLNMRRRSLGSETLPVRLVARGDALLLRHWESRAARWATVQVAIGQEDADWLGHGTMTLMHNGAGKPFTEPAGHERDIDVVFTGTMSYPPNAAAARWIAEDIAPMIRQTMPAASVHLVGRSASRLRLKGVTVHSDVPDVSAYLRRAKVALVPLRTGTGVATKILEAVTNGAVIVATPGAARRAGVPVPVADEAAGLARHVTRILEDDSMRRDLRRALQPWLVRASGHLLTEQLEEVLRSCIDREAAEAARLSPPLAPSE